MIDDVLHEASERMNKAIESLRHDFMTIRTGRASPALVDGIRVDYYGVPTPLQQLATVSIPEAQQIMIKPYSKADMHMIEKAIATSDLGLTPNNDGQAIRLNIPSLNEERRRDLTKVVNKRTEEARVAVRNIRRDAIHDLKEFEREKMISEDDLEVGEKKIQEKTDAMIKRVDELAKEKDTEIMTV